MAWAMSRRSGTRITPKTGAVAVCVPRVASSQSRSTAAHRASARRRRSPHRTPRATAGARRARGDRRAAGQNRRRVRDAVDETIFAADRRSAGGRFARARGASRRRGAALQTPRAAAQGARPHREPRGRLSPLAARPCGARTAVSCRFSAVSGSNPEFTCVDVGHREIGEIWESILLPELHDLPVKPIALHATSSSRSRAASSGR